MLQAKLGRIGKQQQEENSPNLGPTFYPTLVVIMEYIDTGPEKMVCRM